MIRGSIFALVYTQYQGLKWIWQREKWPLPELPEVTYNASPRDIIAPWLLVRILLLKELVMPMV
jgi:hypothetical protein